MDRAVLEEYFFSRSQKFSFLHFLVKNKVIVVSKIASDTRNSTARASRGCCKCLNYRDGGAGGPGRAVAPSLFSKCSVKTTTL